MSTITITTDEIREYQGTETAPLLRIFATKNFTESGGDEIMRSSAEDGDFYKEIICSVVNGTVTYPQFTIDSTVDALSNPSDARYVFALFTAAGQLIQLVLKNIKVPATPTPTTLGALASYSEDNITPAPVGAYTTAQTDALLAAILGKQTIWIPASAITPATTSGPSTAQLETATNKINYAVLDFDGTTRENAHFNVAFPKSWNEGTVTFKAFWETTNASTNGVAWGLQGVALSDNDTVDTAYGTAIYIIDNGQSSAAKRYVSAESAAITIAGTPAVGDSVQFRVHRDPVNGSDTMTQDARLVGIQLFFTTNAHNDA